MPENRSGEEIADVLVVGAGPVGLTMACELARHDVRCRIVDRLPDVVPYCRAIGVTPRTLEVRDDMGIARETIDAGLWTTGLRSIIHGQPTHDDLVSLPDLPYSYLCLPQYETERGSIRHLARFGCRVERGVTLSAMTQDSDSVAVRLSHASGDRETARFRYVIGCDGAHSAVRHAAGIAFEGDAFPMMFMLGDVRIAWDLPRGTSLRAVRPVEDGAPDMFIAARPTVDGWAWRWTSPHRPGGRAAATPNPTSSRHLVVSSSPTWMMRHGGRTRGDRTRTR
jgi:2-polyprenyl-6-methoxyphenol hydroxylase-like FAD-dependent oxidoreductase